MSLTLEQVMQRARKACDRLVDDTARAFETRAILTGADPDAIDAEVAAYRERLTQAIADGLSRVRSELVAWAAETPGGCRNVPTDEPPRTPRGGCCSAPAFKSRG